MIGYAFLVFLVSGQVVSVAGPINGGLNACRAVAKAAYDDVGDVYADPERAKRMPLFQGRRLAFDEIKFGCKLGAGRK